jgi:hypothetical protein
MGFIHVGDVDLVVTLEEIVGIGERAFKIETAREKERANISDINQNSNK